MKHIRCGTEVITETVSEGYSYVCPACDEDLYTFEVTDNFSNTKGTTMNATDRKAIKLQHRQRHIEQLQKLGYIYDTMHAIKRLEHEANYAAVQACNGDITDVEYSDLEMRFNNRLAMLFGGKTPKGFFINGDPRGYALKLDNEAYEVKHPNDLPINYQDWGGYMILAPEEY